MGQETNKRLTEDEVSDLLAKPALSIAEFADIFEVDDKTAYSAVQRGEIPSIDIGRRRLIPTAWVRRKLSVDQ